MRTIFVSLLLCAAACTGCEGLPYVLHLAEGQFAIQGQTEPIDAVLASGKLTDEDAEKLQWIVEARNFAAVRMGLNVGSSYTDFYDAGDDPLVFNLSAVRRDALTPMTWTFPIVGQVPYLAFFDVEYLQRYEAQLQSQGFDTFTYEVDAYSTLGLLEDPVRSPMLRRGVISLVETVIHELLHNTAYRPGETTFNESLATFVGRTGAREFFVERFGAEHEVPLLAAQRFADQDRISAFLLDLHDRLAAHYAQPLSAAEKIAGREAVYQAARERFVNEVQPSLFEPQRYDFYAQLPTNNAWVLANQRYELDQELFRSVYEANGRDWPTTLPVFRAAAGSPGDPVEFLQNWLAERAAP